MADMHAVYRMTDGESRLLYIGRTGDAGRRFGDHASKRWFPLVETIKLEWLPTEAAAILAERRAIQSENPRYNIAERKPPRRRRCPPRTAKSARGAAQSRQKPPVFRFRMPLTLTEEGEYREALLALLQGGTTIGNAAKHLNVTKWSARVHLEALRSEGVARVEGVKSAARWRLVSTAKTDNAP
jgi:hypothetical protein